MSHLCSEWRGVAVSPAEDAFTASLSVVAVIVAAVGRAGLDPFVLAVAAFVVDLFEGAGIETGHASGVRERGAGADPRPGRLA